MWRTVSFVERVEVEFAGNIFNQAIVLGDIDNDMGSELAVGNVDGTLAIFKGRGHKPWRKCSNLGMITCVGAGDVFNKGKVSLYCLTAEGWFYVFDLRIDDQLADGIESHEEDGDNMRPFYKQHLPPNGKVMQTYDVDGDGKLELAIGYSDRVIRLYKWSPGLETEVDPQGCMVQIDMWQLAGQIGSITLNKNKSGKQELLASQPGGTYVKLIHNPDSYKSRTEGYLSAKFYTDDPQFRNRPGKQELLASQPGGTYVKLIHNPDSYKSRTEGIEACSMTNLIYDPLVSSRARNCNISTEIVGSIRKGQGPFKEDESDVLYALCTLDGTLVLVEDSRMLWSIQVDHQLFSLNKLDVTGNGKDEVVCCSWDGQTYIVSHGREAVRYQFEENVAAFTAGYYAVNTTDDMPCFVYATFNNRIFIYYNISLPQVASTNLIEVMNKRQETHALLKRLNLHGPSNRQLQELYHWCLYGWKMRPLKHDKVGT